MKVLKVESRNTSIEEWADVLVSYLPLAYLQGIRDAKGIDAILIGSNGAEVQKRKSSVPFYTEYKSIEEALKGLENNEF